MSSFNSLTVVGNLTRDPVVLTSKNGTNTTHLAIAVNVDNDTSIFYDATIFGKYGESVAQNLKKGMMVGVIGYETKPRIYQDKNGTYNVQLNMVGQTVKFLSARNVAPQKETRATNYDIENPEDYFA